MGEPENGRDVRSSVETRFLDVLNDKIKRLSRVRGTAPVNE